MVYRVILADDHPVVLKGLSLALAKDDLATVVAEAQSPDELLGLLAKTPCDALITDFSMPAPGRDGLALLREVRRCYPDLPVMVITTLANPDIVTKATRERVLAAVRHTGYTPNVAARNLRARRSHMVLVVVPNIENPFFAEVLRGIDEMLSSRGYGLIIANLDN